MEVDFGIKINEPKKGETLFHPYVSFKLSMLNGSAQCVDDREIDEQIQYLQVEIEKMAKHAKRKLKAAMKRHDAILEEMRG